MRASDSSFSSNARTPSTWRITLGYAVMLVAAIGLFLVIRIYGERLTPATAAAAQAGGAAMPKTDILYHVLLALIAIILLGRWLGKLFVYFGQPRVIGEMVAGIMLGPSLLGLVWPQAMNFILPRDVGPFLGIIAQIGVILYMFLVGLELNAGLLRSRAHATIAISHASIVAPFVLGAALALALYPRLSNGEVPFATFALFVGVAMSITAFPVLARVLRDRGIHKTRIGVLAISCAAVDDVTAWCLLALLIAVARNQAGAFLLTAVLVAAYLALMLALGRPALGGLAARVEASDEARPGAVAILLVGVVASALATEAIGIHALFGAFLLGALIPHESKLARALASRLEDVVLVLLLPAFFAVTGLRTELGLLGSGGQWLLFLAILAVACAGKIGGALMMSFWPRRCRTAWVISKAWAQSC